MSFERSLSIKDDMQAEINKEARALSLNILRLLVKQTPVDTGRARGNWFVGLNSPARTSNPDRRSSTALTEGANKIALAKQQAYPVINISNNLPYIEKLNQGSSKQAPTNFVDLTIQRVINQ